MKEGLLQPPQEQSAEPAPQAEGAAPAIADIEMPEEETLDLQNPGQASEEEQASYDAMMNQFFGLIHSKEMKKKIGNKLKEGKENPGKTIGQLATSMFIVTEEKLEGKGVGISDAVRFEAGEDLVAELVQVAVLMGVIPDEDEPIGLAITSAIDVFASAYGKRMKDEGKMSANQLEQVKGDMPMLAEQANSMFNNPENMPSQQSAMSQGVQQAGQQMAPQGGLLGGNQ
tara:strand:+ start:2393 stop:3076 length:684 start_codon:yes stop_codon:yes gene_type:complete